MPYSKVKVERIKKGWTQSDLSKKTSVCRRTVSNIENGKFDNIKLGTLKKIAEILDSSIEELFFSENQ